MIEAHKNSNPGKRFLVLAIILLSLGLIGGVLSSFSYLFPEFLKDSFGFIFMRPFHVSSVMFWIILGATGAVYSSMHLIKPFDKLGVLLSKVQLVLWLIALIGIYYSYANKDFGGREYWEFNPIWALPIVLAWAVFLVNFFRHARTIGRWPVYVWMWLTGISFFLFIFIENYLWVIPYFRKDFIYDMTIQWKVNGSIVGSINQLIYGVSFYLMDRITPNENQKVGFSKMAFAMYFLGLTNLMFNWGHHIYTLPTEDYIRYIAYAVSMTEWIIFLRIIATWRKQLVDFKGHFNHFNYRFLIASEFWVFINLFHALFMSIPAFNIYTHGTHVTVAHSMGTTIGINSMILLTAVFTYLISSEKLKKASKLLTYNFWIMQASLLALFLSLDIAGIIKGQWQMDPNHSSFSEMMAGLSPWFIILVVSGSLLMISFFIYIVYLLRNLSNSKNHGDVRS